MKYYLHLYLLINIDQVEDHVFFLKTKKNNFCFYNSKLIDLNQNYILRLVDVTDCLSKSSSSSSISPCFDDNSSCSSLSSFISFGVSGSLSIGVSNELDGVSKD